MYNKEEFIHNLAKHLTNAILITDNIQEENKDILSLSLKQELELLNSELENMSQVLKQWYN